MCGLHGSLASLHAGWRELHHFLHAGLTVVCIDSTFQHCGCIGVQVREQV